MISRRSFVFLWSGEPADVEALHFEIFLDAALRALPAKTGLFDAAEGSDLGRDRPCVQADHPEFERFGDTPGAFQAPGVEVGRKAEGCGVGDADRLFLVVETEKRGNGSEGLFAGKLHLGRRTTEHHRHRILIAFRHGACGGRILAPFSTASST